MDKHTNMNALRIAVSDKPAAIFNAPTTGISNDYANCPGVAIYLDVMEGLRTIVLIDGEKRTELSVDQFRQ